MSRIQIYDTTLRDGSQGEGVNFSLQDKLLITQKLDELGFDFVEGGYPLSNPKDAEFFRRVRELDLKHVKVCAFGMTRRRGVTADQDVGMKALVGSQAPVCTVVGKTWDMQVTEVMRAQWNAVLAQVATAAGAVFVDSSAAISYQADYADGLHPNASGHAKLAAFWSTVL